MGQKVDDITELAQKKIQEVQEVAKRKVQNAKDISRLAGRKVEDEFDMLGENERGLQLARATCDEIRRISERNRFVCVGRDEEKVASGEATRGGVGGFLGQGVRGSANRARNRGEEVSESGSSSGSSGDGKRDSSSWRRSKDKWKLQRNERWRRARSTALLRKMRWRSCPLLTLITPRIVRTWRTLGLAKTSRTRTRTKWPRAPPPELWMGSIRGPNK